MKMNKLMGLINTANDLASTENEYLTSLRLAKKMVEKELGCKRWVSANIVNVIMYGETVINDAMQETIVKWNNESVDLDVTNPIAKGLRDLGFSVKVSPKQMWGRDNWLQYIEIIK